MFTSCSPGWIKYIEHEFPELLEHLSTCKSPQQMFGPLAKTYYAQKAGIKSENIVVVSIMPCTAKKFEADRPEMYDSGYKDVDYVLTTRELALMVTQAGIEFTDIEESKCDSLLGEHTGAAVIFGATGGVMEAAIRTAYEIVTGEEVPFENLNITPVRGMEGIKEASLKINKTTDDWAFLKGAELKVAIGHGLKNARKLMKQVEQGESPYHFIEIMACPGGCLGGGGQPIPTNAKIRELRAKAIYEEDESLAVRKSHENPEVQRLYLEYLTEGPLGHRSHELLHTKYTKRGKV
jgi:NADH-quinone oxidoreductase subunit G/[NiFe] hydrogenase diaphorase moiety small subunit/NADP-reducing hydrogenase subunit HndD